MTRRRRCCSSQPVLSAWTVHVVRCPLSLNCGEAMSGTGYPSKQRGRCTSTRRGNSVVTAQVDTWPVKEQKTVMPWQPEMYMTWARCRVMAVHAFNYSWIHMDICALDTKQWSQPPMEDWPRASRSASLATDQVIWVREHVDSASVWRVLTVYVNVTTVRVYSVNSAPFSIMMRVLRRPTVFTAPHRPYVIGQDTGGTASHWWNSLFSMHLYLISSW